MVNAKVIRNFEAGTARVVVDGPEGPTGVEFTDVKWTKNAVLIERAENIVARYGV